MASWLNSSFVVLLHYFLNSVYSSSCISLHIFERFSPYVYPFGMPETPLKFNQIYRNELNEVVKSLCCILLLHFLPVKCVCSALCSFCCTSLHLSGTQCHALFAAAFFFSFPSFKGGLNMPCHFSCHYM